MPKSFLDRLLRTTAPWVCFIEGAEGEAESTGTSTTTTTSTEGESTGPESEGEGEGTGTEAEGTDGNAEGEAEGEGKTPEPPAPAKKADWRNKKIGVLTARLKDFERKIGKTPADPADVDSVTMTRAELDSLVESKATERASQQAFTRSLDDTVSAGRKAFPDFDEAVSNLRLVVDETDPKSVAGYSTFLQAALETGEAPKLIHALGSDPDEAQRILGLSPVKMAVELMKLAGATPAVPGGKQISDAKKPILPIGNRGGSHTQIDPADAERSDRLSTKEWMARREKQITDRNARH